MSDKKIVWIDMDGVLVDFNGHVKETIANNTFLREAYKGRYDHIPGIFRNPNQLKVLLKQLRNYMKVESTNYISPQQHLGVTQ